MPTKLPLPVLLGVEFTIGNCLKKYGNNTAGRKFPKSNPIYKTIDPDEAKEKARQHHRMQKNHSVSFLLGFPIFPCDPRQAKVNQSWEQNESKPYQNIVVQSHPHDNSDAHKWSIYFWSRCPLGLRVSTRGVPKK
jgi:hypothetical protein